MFKRKQSNNKQTATPSIKKKKDKRKSKKLYKNILKSYKNKYTLDELDEGIK